MNVKRIILLALCVVILITSAVLPSAAIVTNVDTSGDYDHSREGSYFNTTVSSEDILALLGYTISDAERDYLDEYATLNVRYERVTNQQIRVEKINGETVVTAGNYTYADAKGRSSTWRPVMASIGEETRDFSGSNSVNFGIIDFADDCVVNVKYVMDGIYLASDDVNKILNLAYSDAVDLKEEIAVYTENAEEIREYLDNLSVYEDYLDEKKIYDQKYQEFVDYEEALRLYYENCDKHDKYLDELDIYLTNTSINAELKAKYDAENALYLKYQSDLATVDAQIKMLKDGLLGTSTYLNRQIHGCIFANLVDEVVSKRDELTKIGVKKADIENCEKATANIRAILKPENGAHFVDLKTTDELYAFYINNYEDLRDNIVSLTCALYGVYTTPGMKGTLHLVSTTLGREDYTEKLAIFIAQLIYFSNALSDTPVTHNGKTLDGNVELDYRRLSDGVDVDDAKIYDMLKDKNGNVFVTDSNNAAPISVVEAPKPTEPNYLTVKEPVFVAEPVRPNHVDEPTAPDVKEEPARPDYMPEDLSRLDIVDNQVFKRLVAALDNGLLDTEREELTYNLTYRPTVTLEKKINVTDFVKVTFVTDNGNLTAEVGKGDSVNYFDTLPTKLSDIAASYVFDAWVTDSGEKYDLYAVNEDVTLYPSFRAIYKSYSIVDTSDDYLNVDVRDDGVTFDSVPIDHFIDVAEKNSAAIRLTNDSVVVHIPFSAVKKLDSLEADTLTVSIDASLPMSYKLRVKVIAGDEELNASMYGESITVTIPDADDKLAKEYKLTYFDEQGLAQNDDGSKMGYETGKISFKAVFGREYSIALRYAIDTYSNVSDKLSAPASAAPGETITLDVKLPLGKKAEFYYIIKNDPTYTKYAIDGNTFNMPYGDVTIGATITDIIYTVKFESDGKVLSTKVYTYGEEVKVPNNPTKLNDDEYSYTFIGWSPTITEVTGDVTYVAQFEATLLPKVDKKISWFNVIFYTALVLFILGIISLVLWILNRKGVISIKGAFAFIGSKLSKKKKSETQTSAIPCEKSEENGLNE